MTRTAPFAAFFPSLAGAIALVAAAALCGAAPLAARAQDHGAKPKAPAAQVDGGAYDGVDGEPPAPRKPAEGEKKPVEGEKKPAEGQKPADEHKAPEKHEGKPQDPSHPIHPDLGSDPHDVHAGESVEHPHGYHPMDLRALIVQIVGFAILAYVLWRYAFPPIMKVLEERRQAIRTTFEGFAHRDQELADARANAEFGMREVERKAASRLDAAAREGAELRDALVVEGEQYAASVKERLAQEKELERQVQLLVLRNQMVDSSLKAAEQALKAGVDRPTHDSIVDKFIDDLDSVKVKV